MSIRNMKQTVWQHFSRATIYECSKRKVFTKIFHWKWSSGSKIRLYRWELCDRKMKEKCFSAAHSVCHTLCIKNQEANFKAKSRFVGQKSCRWPGIKHNLWDSPAVSLYWWALPKSFLRGTSDELLSWMAFAKQYSSRTVREHNLVHPLPEPFSNRHR